jgi:uncharacterized protein (DUF983 family)
MKDADQTKPNYLLSALTNKCPRCRHGYIFQSKHAYDFKNNLKMVEFCPECGQPTEIEVGFYYGTGYVSYGLCVALTVASFIAWKVLIGMSFDIEDNRMFYWFVTHVVLMAVLQPLIMRLSRSLWLSWFVAYDPNWKNLHRDKIEKVISGQIH